MKTLMSVALCLVANPAFAVSFQCGFFELCLGDEAKTCQEAAYDLVLEDALTPTPILNTPDETITVAAREKLDDATWSFSGVRADDLADVLQIHNTGRAIYVQQIKVDGVVGSTLRHGLCGVVK